MARKPPAHAYVDEPNLLERRAAAYLRRANPRRDHDLRARRPEELAAILSTERWAIAWAFVAGALSGGILGSAEIFVRRGWLDAMEGMSWSEQLPYWAAFGALGLLVSGLEILFLYWNALRAAARISRAAGIPMSGEPLDEFMARGLARAALEFPNPRAPLYGVDPYARTPRWKLWAYAVLYRTKVGVSSWFLRILLRRMLGRAALRGFIPLFTGPLYAVWNAFITWRVVREARVRSLGPFAIQETVARVQEACAGRPDRERRLVVEAAGEMIIRSADAHPSFALLLGRLLEALEVPAEELDVDWGVQRERLGEAPPEVQGAALEVLVLTSLLDGQVRRPEWALLREAHAAFGRRFQRDRFERVHEKLLRGERLEPEDLAAVSPRTGAPETGPGVPRDRAG